ncbi:YggS family pyridoxal phosphate-dependent enzyme [Tepidibacter hydrothermalis]|uniref:Pyridoxal phosphate homeostasis protein n=1 Tax=Tepidibacter hydrothermalis TaxID=3036126 RepID=A0ABY8E8E5_9FIRM|nr:YggS family pyridoxal phosphate-dependent enzyme [Tepidibacter hydrothermalis]WFD09129.1 YggS family pyridoxal phosphate-dependent enzyme [Tepidibacter hydrothermalis]
MDYIKHNLDEVLGAINNSANKANVNPKNITLIGVTKTVDIPIIEEAIRLGVTHVGENKPQELVRKYEVIGDKVKWHLIGSLQTNKVKYIIDKADMIHSLDRISLCEEINKRAKSINKVMDCLVQVNISREDSKHGLFKEDVMDFVKTVSSKYKNIKINGIMTMAPYVDSPEDVRIYFKEIKNMSKEIEKLNLENVEMKYLSMGMSNDYKIAIEEGANMVRVGTSIFGKRNYMK